METFDFIEDITLRKLAKQFWHEAIIAKQSQLWVTTCALSGATLEVALLATYEQLGDCPVNINKSPLGKLITQLKETHKASVPAHIISTASVITDCRNLFHPGRARFIGIIEKEEAFSTYHSTELVLKWLSQWAKNRFCFTANSLARKIVLTESFDIDKVLEYKNKMSQKQWSMLPSLIDAEYRKIASKAHLGPNTKLPARDRLKAINSAINT